MRWSEISDAGRLWTLPGERTKNRQSHEVPLSSAAQKILLAMPRIVGPKDFVFTTTGSSPVSGYSNAKARLDRAILEVAREEALARGTAPTTVRPWRLHHLRRTVASGMARSGIPPHVIEAMLNHKSGIVSGIAAVYNRYEYTDEKRDALERWARSPAFAPADTDGGSAGVAVTAQVRL